DRAVRRRGIRLRRRGARRRGVPRMRGAGDPREPRPPRDLIEERLECGFMSVTPRLGTISWQDLTVEDAEQARDFYEAVAGSRPDALRMGGHFRLLVRGAHSM